MTPSTQPHTLHSLAPRQTNPVLLDIRQLDVRFKGSQGTLHAVRGLDLQLHQGETLALVGESGCGKSTTALALLRLLAPGAQVSGQILLDGRDIVQLPLDALRKLRGREVSMIFQEPMTSLNPVYTVGTQIIETLRQHESISAAAARQRAIELLDLVRIPEPQRRVDDYPHQLSGGQRQRVMIAMAVACHPRLLVADEPTTALDVTIQAQILELLDRLRRELSMSLLLITHDLGVVSQWADRVAVMYGGEKVEEASTAQLFAAPAHPYTRGLLGASLHAGQDLHYTEARLPEIQSRKHPETGLRSFDLHTPKARPRDTGRKAQAAPLLAVEHLRTDYATRTGVVHAVDDVSFSIGVGETVGLVGESGCGKSTLSKTLLHLVQPAAGRIVFEGTDLTALKGNALQPWRQRMQMVFQDPYASLNPRRTVYDILDTVLYVHGNRSRQDRQRSIASILDRVGLPSNAGNRYPHEFSGGQRQRIGIARALVVKPSLVICDEPVSALDVSIQAQILNLLVELKEEFQLSYLFISHDLAVVRYIADRVLVMHQGRFVETGDHRSIWAQPQHEYTRSLIAAVPRAEQRKVA
ncbi:peptide/nickel transport system ATP-binding protein [Acidovorax sp. 56]|uniref:ABC transporter ATP-binding protein n=1 Tax=Acidovorax sp. 56 TaxID=2035205 RepID=UPI000C16B063|nr:ABC transporter ATP-binding protein [Acidovorax sp. 56]PIF27320.1 peptide/nickel transport system ATP-binding protein [Acidovorax sp. 56]